MSVSLHGRAHVCASVWLALFTFVFVFFSDRAPRSLAWLHTRPQVAAGRPIRPCHRYSHRYAGQNTSHDVPRKDTKVPERKKKNKYAKFSKADRLGQDPLDSLILESEEKMRQIQLENERRRNRAIPKDCLQQQEKLVWNQLKFPDIKTIDPYDPTTYGYTELGTIIGAHGVKGLVKIASVTDFPERLCRPGVRHLKAQNRRSPRQIQLLDGRHRIGDEYLIKLEGIGDRDAANKLRGSVLYARQEERPEDVGEDEYLVSDLVGLEVFLEVDYKDDFETAKNDSEEIEIAGRFVGTVGGIVLAQEMCDIPGLGQDLLEIVLPRGQGGITSWRDEMVLIPLVPEIVPRVVLKDRAIYITPPDGLLDLTYVREEKVRIKGFLPPAKNST